MIATKKSTMLCIQIITMVQLTSKFTTQWLFRIRLLFYKRHKALHTCHMRVKKLSKTRVFREYFTPVKKLHKYLYMIPRVMRNTCVYSYITMHAYLDTYIVTYVCTYVHL